MLQKIKRFSKKKSVIGFFSIAVVTSTIVGLKMNKAEEPTKYVLSAVEKGMIATSVEGTGQVSGEREIDLKPSVSGRIVAVFVKEGEAVTTDTPLFEIERTDAVKEVRDAGLAVQDAQLSLASARLSLDELSSASEDSEALLQAENRVRQAERKLASLKEGPDEYEIKQAQNDVDTKKTDLELSSDGVTVRMIREAYDDAVPVLSAVSQTVMDALRHADSVLGVDGPQSNEALERQLSALNSSVLPAAKSAYAAAKPVNTAYETLARSLEASDEDAQVILNAFDSAQDALDATDELLKLTHDALIYTIPSATLTQSTIDGLRNTIQSDRTAIASKQTSLNNARQAIETAETDEVSARLALEKAENTLAELLDGSSADDIASAEESLAEAKAALAKLKEPADDLDIASAKLVVAQRESSLEAARNRLADAQESLNDYTVRSPIDGVIASVDAYAGDEASPSTALAVLISDRMIASVSLNEVDIASIKTGQKATVTFDALPDLSVAATVASVDVIGTANQGVVTYGVDIAFLTDDDRIKSGMSASVSIVTDAHTDVLTVPNAAVRSGGGVSYVEMLEGEVDASALSSGGIESKTPPVQRVVQIGLSNDESTEITNGLSEGDYVITRTIAASSESTAKASTGRSSGGFGMIMGGPR